MENTTPELQESNELENQAEIDESVGADNQEPQTPNEQEADEYDEIVLTGEEQASQKYTPEEVLVHKLSKMRKSKSEATKQLSAAEVENAQLKQQLAQMRKDLGYEEQDPKPQTQAPAAQPQQIDDAVFDGHYSRAAQLKVTDYEDTERKLRENLGNELVDALIVEARDKSPIVLYHLQKNPNKLEQFKVALSTDVGDAQRMIWKLSEDLKVNKVRRDPVPAPDEIPRGQSTTMTPQKELDAMRDKYVAEINSGGDGQAIFNQMRAFKKAHNL